MLKNIRMKANEKQQSAIEHSEGPLLIIAGAGSWKTATLTQRIGHMISEKGILPSSILALTFTNKAAWEMKERTGNTIGQQYHPHMMKNRHLPYMGTFHSFGIFVLKEILSSQMSQQVGEVIGLKKDFIIYDEQDKLSVMKDIIKNELWLIEKEYPPRQISYYISDAKNKWMRSQEFKWQVDSHLKEVVSSVFERYEKRLIDNNAIDFDDILLKLQKLLEIPEVLDIYQQRYTYIMVDEYQDTNMVQYNIVKMLASLHRNLAVVGDDWQSIYSWRWADMRNILSFKKDYPEAEVIKLEQNYRSTKNIISWANALIKNNKEALDKELWTENISWEKIQYLEAVSDTSEANWIAENIKESVWKEWKYSENLILYRTNAQSRGLEEALLRNNIPYKVIGGMKFYDRKEIKDMLAYLRCILNPSEPVSFKRIINTPSRKIGAKSLEVLDECRENFWIWYFEILENITELEELRPMAKAALQDFFELFQGLFQASKNLSVSLLIWEVISKTWYEDYLRSQFSADEFESKRENLSELQNVASDYDGLAPREGLSLFLEEVALISDLDNKDETQESVTLMTIHTSKWLEEKRVFVTGLEEGIFPHSRTHSNPRELEEERRLMYVAMTRAKEELCITRAKERLYFWDYVRNPESRFIGEIPSELLEKVDNSWGFTFDSMSSWFSSFESTMKAVKKPVLENNVTDFKTGMRVQHHKFWIGIIDSLVWELAEIRFRAWIKKMNIRIAPVKIVND